MKSKDYEAMIEVLAQSHSIRLRHVRPRVFVMMKMATLLFALAGSVGVAVQVSSAQDPAYQTRRSDCHCIPPPGTPLKAKKTDSGIQVSGWRAERLITHIAEAAGLRGGEIAVCAEYGRVEIIDSDDSQVRLQIRAEATGDGAAKAIEDTDIRIHLTAHAGKLSVAVWHATQGFTPEHQPSWINIRLQVPSSGAYKIDGTAYHGIFRFSQVTLAGGKLRGRAGEKYKGIKGYWGGIELDGVALSDDLDVGTHVASITGKIRPLSTCKITAHTEAGDIRLSISTDERTGLYLVGGSNEGTARALLDDSETLSPPKPEFRTEQHARSKGYETKPIRVEVRATSRSANVMVVSPAKSEKPMPLPLR